MSSEEQSAFRPAIDVHTHLFPEQLAAAIQRSLSAEAGWDFSTPTTPSAIEDVLREAGITTYVALPYAHKVGVASEINEWLLDQTDSLELLIPFATVHPDDEAVATIVRDAFERGARGLKIHCPVQECRPADSRLEPALELAAEYDRPITYHGGTAPMFEDSPYVGADAFTELVTSYPELRVCCAHMGTYEVEAFLELARDNANVYLDTTMAMSTSAEETMGFDPSTIANETLIELSTSIMYGTDFPNIPYPYRNERAELLARDLPRATVRDIFYRTAANYLDLDEKTILEGR